MWECGDLVHTDIKSLHKGKCAVLAIVLFCPPPQEMLVFCWSGVLLQPARAADFPRLGSSHHTAETSELRVASMSALLTRQFEWLVGSSRQFRFGENLFAWPT